MAKKKRCRLCGGKTSLPKESTLTVVHTACSYGLGRPESLADTVERLLPHINRTGKGDVVYKQLKRALKREAR